MTSLAPTLLVMAGGTGGHIMPGLAVASLLRERGWQVVWLGNPEAMEGRLVPEQGIPLAAVRFSGLRGKGWSARLALPWRLLRALWQAWRAIGRIRPTVVLGLGGYVAFPGGVVARLRGVPMVVHEQNAVAGLTNRALARLARRVLCGFPNTRGLDGAEVVGNPVRQEIAALPVPRERWAGRAGPLRLLVLGGSLGAQALNTVVPQALAQLRAEGGDLPQVTHQAGQAHLEALQGNYESAGVAADCLAFVDDMAAALGQADLVICRAGAMSVAEIAAAGVPALFVPFPHAVDDHQTANAQHLVHAGGAWLRQQSELDAPWLAQWLAARERSELLRVAELARAQGQADATERIADICTETAGEDRS